MVYDENELQVIKDFYSIKKIKELVHQRHVYVVLNGNEIEASAAVEPFEGNKEIAYISMVYSSPNKEGKGLGRIAIKAVEEDEYSKEAKMFRIHALLNSYRCYALAGYKYYQDTPQIINDKGVQAYILVKDKK